jgi:hypothetical protein
VIGLGFGRTFDIRTDGWRLIAPPTSSGCTFRPPTLITPLAAPEKVVAIPAPLDGVAVSTKPSESASGPSCLVQVLERVRFERSLQRSVRPRAPRVAVAAGDRRAGGKARQAVVNVEADAGFGRREGVRNDRARGIARTQRIQNRLIGDSPQTAGCTRRDRAGVGRSSARGASAWACRSRA